ncbi:NEMP family protein [Dioscorea alata]|uniref:NEMP family protein n=1 Tax=Dioscorea alata TaxID=55571 RepID=A0ACB7UX46_DIOAL|nr:NEMP family protein [Dioscorea alata]
MKAKLIVHLLLSIIVLLFAVVGCSFAFPEEFSAIAKLRLPSGQSVANSPGASPGSIVACNRVHFRGLPRFQNLRKFAHSRKIRVSVDQGDGFLRPQTVEVCLHRNSSIGLCMCSDSQWQRLYKGSWMHSISPYGDVILDIRRSINFASPIEVYSDEEFLFHRVVFLVVGMVLMLLARVLSESIVFYYGSAMTIGIILVILMILFQGMKLLPTGRKSSLAIFMYSSVVGAATVILHYVSGLLHSVLIEIGIGEDMHNPVCKLSIQSSDYIYIVW